MPPFIPPTSNDFLSTLPEEAKKADPASEDAGITAVPVKKELPKDNPVLNTYTPTNKPIFNRYLTKTSWMPLKGSVKFMLNPSVPSEEASKVMPDKIWSDTAVLLLQAGHAALIMGGFDSTKLVDPSSVSKSVEKSKNKLSPLETQITHLEQDINRKKEMIRGAESVLEEIKKRSDPPVKTERLEVMRGYIKNLNAELNDYQAELSEAEKQKEDLIKEVEKEELLQQAAQEHIFSWYPTNPLPLNQFGASVSGLHAASKITASAITGPGAVAVAAGAALSVFVNYNLWGKKLGDPLQNPLLSRTTVTDGRNHLKEDEGVFAIPLNGLDIEAMKAKAREIKEQHKFEMLGMNCAKSVIEILKAGVPTEIAQQVPEGWGWSTPTDVENMVSFLAEKGCINIGDIGDEGEAWFDAKE